MNPLADGARSRDFSLGGEPQTPKEDPVDAARIQARAVVKVAAISLAVVAGALLLAVVVLEVRTTIRWIFAAIFLTLALLPAVDRAESLRVRGRKLPR